MTVTFPLTKKHYYRPPEAFGANFKYCLKSEILDWFRKTHIQYDRFYWKTDTNRDGQIVLRSFIEFNDHNNAMLFKLTWL